MMNESSCCTAIQFYISLPCNNTETTMQQEAFMLKIDFKICPCIPNSRVKTTWPVGEMKDRAAVWTGEYSLLSLLHLYGFIRVASVEAAHPLNVTAFFNDAAIPFSPVKLPRYLSWELKACFEYQSLTTKVLGFLNVGTGHVCFSTSGSLQT